MNISEENLSNAEKAYVDRYVQDIEKINKAGKLTPDGIALLFAKVKHEEIELNQAWRRLFEACLPDIIEKLFKYENEGTQFNWSLAKLIKIGKIALSKHISLMLNAVNNDAFKLTDEYLTKEFFYDCFDNILKNLWTPAVTKTEDIVFKDFKSALEQVNLIENLKAGNLEFKYVEDKLFDMNKDSIKLVATELCLQREDPAFSDNFDFKLTNDHVIDISMLALKASIKDFLKLCSSGKKSATGFYNYIMTSVGMALHIALGSKL